MLRQSQQCGFGGCINVLLQPYIEHLAGREQAQAVGLLADGAPAIRAFNMQHVAFVDAGLTGSQANRIPRFLFKQRFITGQQIERGEAPGKLIRQLFGIDLHVCVSEALCQLRCGCAVRWPTRRQCRDELIGNIHPQFLP